MILFFDFAILNSVFYHFFAFQIQTYSFLTQHRLPAPVKCDIVRFGHEKLAFPAANEKRGIHFIRAAFQIGRCLLFCISFFISS